MEIQRQKVSLPMIFYPAKIFIKKKKRKKKTPGSNYYPKNLV